MKDKPKFETPFAMKCNQKQFDSVKYKLIEMGYSIKDIRNWDINPYFINNGMDHNGIVSNCLGVLRGFGGRLVFDEWSEKLCLALAAMTDVANGIKRERWVCTIDFYSECFTNGIIYEQAKRDQCTMTMQSSC